MSHWKYVTFSLYLYLKQTINKRGGVGGIKCEWPQMQDLLKILLKITTYGTPNMDPQQSLYFIQLW